MQRRIPCVLPIVSLDTSGFAGHHMLGVDFAFGCAFRPRHFVCVSDSGVPFAPVTSFVSDAGVPFAPVTASCLASYP